MGIEGNSAKIHDKRCRNKEIKLGQQELQTDIILMKIPILHGMYGFSSLTTDPMIAFNFISDIQTLSDSAFAEYSTDGTTWSRLGCYNCGLNWYNGYQNKLHWDSYFSLASSTY